MRNLVSATAGVNPTTDGTGTFPVPTATSMLTSDPFLTFVPAAGACLMTDPGTAFGSVTICTVGDSFTPALSASDWAANTFLACVRLGTTVCLGISRITAATIAAASGTAIDSHQGSHARCRYVAGIGGGAAALGPA